MKFGLYIKKVQAIIDFNLLMHWTYNSQYFYGL